MTCWNDGYASVSIIRLTASRTKRSVFNALAGASLLFCAVTLLVGVRSIWWFNELEGRGPSRVHRGYYSIIVISSNLGHLSLLIMDPLDREATDSTTWKWTWGDWPAARDVSSRRFSWRDQWFKLWIIRNEDVQPASGTPPGLREGGDLGLSLPYWSFSVVGGVLPAWWAMKRARRRPALSDNRCLKCGYDLRGSPDRCPECGRVVSPAFIKTASSVE